MNINDKAYEYLLVQRGEVSDFASSGFTAWQHAYETSLEKIYYNIVPHLPMNCGRILDIGSGLGGINILLDKHYGNHPQINLLDGMDDPAKGQPKGETFNDMKVAKDFLTTNGVRDVYCWSPSNFPHGRFDLIVSFAAYGFTIPPSVYLKKLIMACHSETRVILDVRRSIGWRAIFNKGFMRQNVIAETDKFYRIIYQGARHEIAFR